MARNLAVSGILGGLSGWGQGMAQTAQMQAQQDFQQRMLMEREELLRGRQAERVAAGGGGSGRPGVLFDAADAQSRYEFATKPVGDDPELRGQYLQTVKQLGADGQGTVVAQSERFDGARLLYEQKLSERQSLREALAVGAGNFDDLAKGRATDAERQRLTRIEQAEGAPVAQLAAGHKGRYDGGNVGATDVTTGRQSLNPLGRAQAADEIASADRHKAEALDIPDKRRKGDATERRLVEAEERRQAADLRADIKDLTQQLDQLSYSDPRRKALEDELNQLRAAQDRLRAGRRDGQEASAPPPPAEPTKAKRRVWDPASGKFKEVS